MSTFILGLIGLFPFFIWERAVSAPVAYSPKIVGAIIYVGVCASLMAFVLWNKAIAAVGPAKAAMIYYTLPLFSGFLAYLLLGEAISRLHFYCLVLIVTGILITNYASPAAKNEESVTK